VINIDKEQLAVSHLLLERKGEAEAMLPLAQKEKEKLQGITMGTGSRKERNTT